MAYFIFGIMLARYGYWFEQKLAYSYAYIVEACSPMVDETCIVLILRARGPRKCGLPVDKGKKWNLFEMKSNTRNESITRQQKKQM